MHFSDLVKGAAIGLAMATGASAGFNGDRQDNVVMYWGQASAGYQADLATYCQQTDGDIYVVSFLNKFGVGNDEDGKPVFTSALCDGKVCDHIGEDIKKCQSLGKTVMLSLGGGIGDYGFKSNKQAEQFADELWAMYGGGDGEDRPFGDAVVDGFDIDNETKVQTGYVALVNRLRSHFSKSAKSFYISAAPQCHLPDASVGDILEQTHIDFAFIQFYNNPCSLVGEDYNWSTWSQYAKSNCRNKNIKLFIGIPGSKAGASYGYASPDKVKNQIAKISLDDGSFAGCMLWDASQAYANKINGKTFASHIKNILSDRQKPAPVVSTTPIVSSSVPVPFPTSTGYANGTLTSSIPPVPTSTDHSQSDDSASGSSDPGSDSDAGSSGSNGGSYSGSGSSSGSSNSDSDSGSSGSGSDSGSSSGSGSGDESKYVTHPAGTKTPIDQATRPAKCSGKNGSGLAACINKDNNRKLPAPKHGDTCGYEGQLACRSGKVCHCKNSQWQVSSCASGSTCSASSTGDSVFIGCVAHSSPDVCKRRNSNHQHHKHKRAQQVQVVEL